MEPYVCGYMTMASWFYRRVVQISTRVPLKLHRLLLLHSYALEIGGMTDSLLGRIHASWLQVMKNPI